MSSILEFDGERGYALVVVINLITSLTEAIVGYSIDSIRWIVRV